MKDKKPLDWIPLYIDKHLFGSTRLEFEPDERSVWIDLLVLSGKDSGYVRANIGMPYPLTQLAGMLVIPVELLERTIKKSVKYGKIKIIKDGSLYLPGWVNYKLSPRHKRRFEAESANEDIESAKADTDLPSADTIEIDIDKEIDINKEEKRKSNLSPQQKEKINNELKKIKGIGEIIRAAIISYLDELSIEFPDIDYIEEMKKKCSWWRDHPLTKKSNIHLQLRNWFRLAMKFQKESDKEKRVGESTHAPSKKEDDYSKARAIKMKEIQEKHQPEIDKAMKGKNSDWMDEIDNKMKEEIAEFSREYHAKNPN